MSIELCLRRHFHYLLITKKISTIQIYQQFFLVCLFNPYMSVTKEEKNIHQLTIFSLQKNFSMPSFYVKLPKRKLFSTPSSRKHRILFNLLDKSSIFNLDCCNILLINQWPKLNGPNLSGANQKDLSTLFESQQIEFILYSTVIKCKEKLANIS